MTKRLMSIMVVVAFAATIVLIGSCDKIGNIPGTVAGQLLNEAGQGQGFISVRLVQTESGKVVDSVNADDNGNFMFKNVDPGTYKIVTTPIGGGELENDAKEFKLMPGKTENLDITVIYPNK